MPGGETANNAQWRVSKVEDAPLTLPSPLVRRGERVAEGRVRDRPRQFAQPRHFALNIQFAAGNFAPVLCSALRVPRSALTRSRPASFASTCLEILQSRISIRRGVTAAISGSCVTSAMV